MINVAAAQARARREGRRASGADLVILSLGAGIQSTTMALMAAHGEIERPDCAIFADTRWEGRKVYEHLSWLSSRNVLPFPVRRVSRADIREGIRIRRAPSSAVRFAAIPWWTVNPDGSEGMGSRQCTSEYKLEPIMQEVRTLLGKGRRDRIRADAVEVMIGISIDEAHRMRPARQRYMVNRWPLVEKGMSRQDCERWLVTHEYPVPPKSACIGCPFHDDDYWRDMRDNRPDEWAEAVEYDRILRTGDARGMKVVEFMHRQRVPLDQVDLSPSAERPPDLFGNECEGMCGV